MITEKVVRQGCRTGVWSDRDSPVCRQMNKCCIKLYIVRTRGEEYTFPHKVRFGVAASAARTGVYIAALAEGGRGYERDFEGVGDEKKLPEF